MTISFASLPWPYTQFLGLLALFLLLLIPAPTKPRASTPEPPAFRCPFTRQRLFGASFQQGSTKVVIISVVPLQPTKLTTIFACFFHCFSKHKHSSPNLLVKQIPIQGVMFQSPFLENISKLPKVSLKASFPRLWREEAAALPAGLLNLHFPQADHLFFSQSSYICGGARWTGGGTGCSGLFSELSLLSTARWLNPTFRCFNFWAFGCTIQGQ